MTETYRHQRENIVERDLTFGQYMRSRALDRGLSARDIARITGNSPETIRRLFRDASAGPETIFKVFSALHFSTDEAIETLLKFRPPGRFTFLR